MVLVIDPWLHSHREVESLGALCRSSDATLRLAELNLIDAVWQDQPAKPLAPKLIDVALLTDAERGWVNDYHRRVYDAHAGQLDERERAWLERITQGL